MKVQILLVVFGFVAASSAAPSQHSQSESAEEWFELDSSEAKELEQNMEDAVHDLGFSDSDVEEFMEEAGVADQDMEDFFEQLESELKDFHPKGLEATGDALEGALDVAEAGMDEVEEALDEVEEALDEAEDEVDDVEETVDEAEVLSDLMSDEESHED